VPGVHGDTSQLLPRDLVILQQVSPSSRHDLHHYVVQVRLGPIEA